MMMMIEIKLPFPRAKGLSDSPYSPLTLKAGCLSFYCDQAPQCFPTGEAFSVYEGFRSAITDPSFTRDSDESSAGNRPSQLLLKNPTSPFITWDPYANPYVSPIM